MRNVIEYLEKKNGILVILFERKNKTFDGRADHCCR